jgi:hypothetical protein
LPVAGGGVVHVLDTEARQLGWHVSEVPAHSWGASHTYDSHSLPYEASAPAATTYASDAEPPEAPALPAPTRRMLRGGIHNHGLRDALARRKAARLAAGLPAAPPRSGTRKRRKTAAGAT